LIDNHLIAFLESAAALLPAAFTIPDIHFLPAIRPAEGLSLARIPSTRCRRKAAMNKDRIRQPVTLSREAPYDQVWASPMMRLAEQYGITGTGLAKICAP
jgi:hypothetical protein